MADQYLRNPNALIAGNSSGAVLISPDGSSVFLRKHTDKLFKLVELLREPHSLQQIEEELQESSSALAPLIALLEKRGIVVHGAADMIATVIPQRARTETPLCRNIVVGICGAVQAATCIPLLVTIQRILAREVDVVLTDSAENFISPNVLSYFGFRVWNDMYQATDVVNVPHIHLAAQADLVLVIPATANTIHRVASGACSDLLSLVISATRAPVVMVPTMNTAMLQFAPIRRNIAALRSSGIYVVEPGLGCEVSRGHEDEFKFCGIGLTEVNVFRGLAAIVAAHGEVTTGSASRNAVPSKVSAMQQRETGQPEAVTMKEPA